MIDPDRADLPFEAASSFDDHFVLDGDSAGRAQVTMTLYPSTYTQSRKGTLQHLGQSDGIPNREGPLYIYSKTHTVFARVLGFRSVLAPKPNDVQGQ
ncbi:hypothetical protein FOPG_10204 [Fusarium oxysporum f. sp. conglutinans race 2 54008]|nr:hypothetical protein FOPG_10204 [Fusarium oxysporum f. sp. conglutinans race 2 54008]KAG6996641.1 hypothetical protein FocnCong_v015974 [Fusarium oxysporum f. sp. conglutinans]KAI8411971.1 hypothetical protein FOFC_08587 [Fusarium oxysporum]